MSTSPMISKSINNNRMDNDDPYSTLYVENLLGVYQNIFITNLIYNRVLTNGEIYKKL
jgi:hypothetical protein